MKDKILKSLKTKYVNLGFGDRAFEGVADYLATTVKEEADIETAISGVEPMLKAFQGDADKVRSENTALKSQIEAVKKTESKKQTAKTETEPDGDDTPEWAKQMASGFASIQAEIASIKADRVTGSRRGKLDGALKDAPEALKNMIVKNFTKMKFEDDADFDAYLADVSTQVDEVAKEVRIDGVSGNGKSSKGTSSDGKPKEATKEQIDAVMQNLSF